MPYITGDIRENNTPNYGEKRVEIGGGSGGIFFVDSVSEGGTTTLTETWNTIMSKAEDSIVIVRYHNEENSFYIGYFVYGYFEEGYYYISFTDSDAFATDSADGYPSVTLI